MSIGTNVFKTDFMFPVACKYHFAYRLYSKFVSKQKLEDRLWIKAIRQWLLLFPY